MFAATAPAALFEFYDPHVKVDGLCEVRALLGCHFLNTNDSTVIAEMNELETNRQSGMPANVQTLLSGKPPAGKKDKSGKNLYSSFFASVCKTGHVELMQVRQELNSFVTYLLLRKDDHGLLDTEIENMMAFVSASEKMGTKNYPRLAEFLASLDEGEVGVAHLSKTIKKLPDTLKKQDACVAAERELGEDHFKMLCRNFVCKLPTNGRWFSELPMVLLVRKDCSTFPAGTVTPPDYATTVLMFLNCDLNTTAPVQLCLTSGQPCYAAVLEVYSADGDFGTLETGLFPSTVACFDTSSLLYTFSRFIGSTSDRINGVPVKSHWTIINGKGNFANFYNTSGIPASRIKKF